VPTDASRWVAGLRLSHDQLVERIATLDADALLVNSFCPGGISPRCSLTSAARRRCSTCWSRLE
jgi:hypothetical protein